MSKHRGLTVLELLVVIGIVAGLAALILPAVHAARESAWRIQCIDHLRQIGLALHTHHGQHQCLPPGWRCDSSGESAYGWAVPLLPYLEQSPIHDQIDYRRPVSDSANLAPRQASLAMFLCPSDYTEPTFPHFREDERTGRATHLVDLPTTNYVGVFGTIDPDDDSETPVLGDGTFVADRRICFSDLRRGLSNTMVVGERTMARLPSSWLGTSLRGEDPWGRLVGAAITFPNTDQAGEDDEEENEPEECEFYSRHRGGVNFLWGDGHVRFVADSIGREEYRMLARRRAVNGR